MSDWQGWESLVEGQFGASSQQDTAILDAWQQKEGAGGAFNPLNTTVPIQTPFGAGVRDPGSWNTAGVLDYPNPQAGAWATRAAIEQNAPGFARGLSVENPLSLPDATLEAGFNWLGGGPGTASNQAYAQSIVDTARATVGQPAGSGGPPPLQPGTSPPAASTQCYATGWVQRGPGDTCYYVSKGFDPSNPNETSYQGKIVNGQCCVTQGTPSSSTPYTGPYTGGQGLIDCISNAGGSSILGIGVPGSQQLSQIGCFFSLDGLEVMGGALILLIGLSRLAGVHVPFVPGAA